MWFNKTVKNAVTLSRGENRSIGKNDKQKRSGVSMGDPVRLKKVQAVIREHGRHDR